MSRAVKNACQSHSPSHAPGNDKPTPRRTGAPAVSKFKGTENSGAGKYVKRHAQGKGDVVIWKDLPQ